jgi:predicted secreted protein
MAGKDGSFKLGAAAMAYIDNWQLNIKSGVAETSKLGTDYKEFIGTVSEFDGSASGSLDVTDTAQKAALTQMTGGAVVATAAEFALDATSKFAGNVLLTSVSIGAPHGDKVSFSCNMQGTGVLTPTYPA